MAIPGLGSPMSLSDEKYLSSAAYIAGASLAAPDCEMPGFDPLLCPSPEALLGRWVRSPKKFVGWDTYMEFFGLAGDKALQETEEPQEHVFLEFSKEKMRILHRLPWRDGLDCEYSIPIDGSVQPIPPAMVARAASSWKVNDLATWVHEWDHGNDGNPLHRGLRTEQKMCIGGTNYALRYWRSMIRPGEIRVNVEVTYADTGKYAVHTQRFFHKIDVNRVYSIACAGGNLNRVATWTHGGRAVRLALLPHESNMPSGWRDLSEEKRWEAAEPFPSAGRSSGAYLTQMRDQARDLGLWICVGLVLRANSDKDKFGLVRGIALIGADGWLHAVHADTAPIDELFIAGVGEWPATQRARPLGVYDTELGRIALFPEAPTTETITKFGAMGAELVLVPPEAGSSFRDDASSRAHLALCAAEEQPFHGARTQYELCGPDPLPAPSAPSEFWKMTVVKYSDGELEPSVQELRASELPGCLKKMADGYA